MYGQAANQANLNQAQANAAAILQQAQLNQNVDPFNLLNQNEIPDVLENDDIFSRYTCPITSRPIRDPVGDPTTRNAGGMTLYERPAIVTWLQTHNSCSPSTNRPLNVASLVEQPFVKALIEDRLRYYSTELRRHAENQFHVAPEPGVLIAAQNENARY